MGLGLGLGSMKGLLSIALSATAFGPGGTSCETICVMRYSSWILKKALATVSWL